MTDTEQKIAAKAFAEHWQGRGNDHLKREMEVSIAVMPQVGNGFSLFIRHGYSSSLREVPLNTHWKKNGEVVRPIIKAPAISD